ncbi:hypothetical protein SEVIR_4G255701v4 [Setaria viridis]
MAEADVAAKIAAGTASTWSEQWRSMVARGGEVALLGRSLDVGGGLDHGDVEVLALAAAVTESLMAPHALRQPLCTDAVPISRRLQRRPARFLLSAFGSRDKSSPPRGQISEWCDVRGCSCDPCNASATESIKSKNDGALAGRPPGAAERRSVIAGCRR